MKNWIVMALCICLAMSVTACSQINNTKEPQTSQNQSISENPSTSSEREADNELPDSSDDEASYSEEFIQKAYAMGYTDDQLEMLKSGGISEELILNPESVSIHGAQTSDGHYILCSYEIDFLRSCMYLLDAQTGKINILPEWQNGYSTFDFIDDKIFYAAIPQVGGASYEAGIRLYSVDQPNQPYAAWNLTDSNDDSDLQKILLDTYHCKDGKMILASWCEIPVEWGGWVKDDTETYRITLIDYQANVVKSVDTGIKLSQSKTGVAYPNFDKPNVHLEPLENCIYFDVGETTYIFNYISGQVSIK